MQRMYNLILHKKILIMFTQLCVNYFFTKKVINTNFGGHYCYNTLISYPKENKNVGITDALEEITYGICDYH